MITIYSTSVHPNIFTKQLIKGIKKDKLNILVDSVLDFSINSELYFSPSLCSVIKALFNDKDIEETFSISQLLNHLNYQNYNFNDFDMLINFLFSLKLLKDNDYELALDHISETLNIKAKIIPITNEKVDTKIILKEEGKLNEITPFEYYYISKTAEIDSATLQNIDKIQISESAKKAILKSELLIFCQPDPLSLYTIINLPEMKKTIETFSGKILAICPLNLNEKEQKIMQALGQSPTIFGFINLLLGMADSLIVDEFDTDLLLQARAQNLGMEFYPLNYGELSEDENKIIRKIIKITSVDSSYFVEECEPAAAKIKKPYSQLRHN